MCKFLRMDTMTTLKTWDASESQKIVSVKCRVCDTIYTDRQSMNDCVSMYPYEYPKKGYYWCENKECFKCSIKKIDNVFILS